MNAPRHDFATTGLVADVLTSASRVVQGEIALLRAEARERAQFAQAAVVLGVLAAVLGMTALNVLAGAAVTALGALGLAPHWATLVVGVVLTVMAIALARAGMAALRNATTGPVRAVAQVSRDIETLQTMVKQDATA
jgi:protein-S-isoprenylcysteine O-methyltransferase Ste14